MSGSSRANLALPVVACVLALAAAWRILSLGVADHLSNSDPDRALEWRSNHPVALIGAAEAQLGEKYVPASVAELARGALRSNPLEGRAYRIFGRLAEASGDPVAAVRFYELASQRAPRDLPAHAWLEAHYLREGRLGLALRHVDLLLRVQPELVERQFPLLQAMAARPEAQAPLAELLGGDPPWRQSFMSRLYQGDADSQAIAPFITLLGASKAGLSDFELAAWIDRLARDRHWGQAYLAWVAALPSNQQAELANLFNGGFEREPTNGGFDWRIGNAPGAYIERLHTTGAGGKFALRVSFEDRRIPFNHVRQLLALPPGSYRLEGRASAEGLRTERGLVWSVLCADDNQVVGSTEPLLGRSPWHPFVVRFQVPAGRCGGQWLQLGVPARIAAEQRIGGRAWFDDLRIVRER